MCKITAQLIILNEDNIDTFNICIKQYLNILITIGILIKIILNKNNKNLIWLLEYKNMNIIILLKDI